VSIGAEVLSGMVAVEEGFDGDLGGGMVDWECV
jgi:hypothetical protein